MIKRCSLQPLIVEIIGYDLEIIPLLNSQVLSLHDLKVELGNILLNFVLDNLSTQLDLLLFHLVKEERSHGLLHQHSLKMVN